MATVNSSKVFFGWQIVFVTRILLPKGREEILIKELLINNQIREKEVRLLGADGEQIGIMSSFEANNIADEQNLDLVLISPTAKPPVCKLMDYGKYKYETTKREKENRKTQKEKIVELKEVWLSASIDVGDLNTKAKSARKFLESGDRVRASIRLKGRLITRPELAVGVMDDFFDLLKDVSTMEKRPVLEGRTVAMILNPIVKK